MTVPENETRVPVQVTVCDKRVTPAPEQVIGQCTYYYRPMGGEFANKDTLDGARKWASEQEWWGHESIEWLLGEREELIKADSGSPNWSRHANFLMRHINCGHRPPDYYVSYGYYYCSTYGARLLPSLSPAGQAWLIDARKLLQRNMEKGLYDNMRGDSIVVSCQRFPERSSTMSCKRYELEVDPELFKKFAYGTHVPAYLDGGLADLPISDLTKIGMQPKVGDLYFDRNGLGQAWESGVEVGKHKAGQAWDASAEAVNDALRRLQSIFK
jgi:hypothetical protein